MNKCILLAGIACAGLSWSAAGHAQGAASGASETAQATDNEIIVTANRREQNVQDVGVVVAQFSSDDLVAAGITDTAGLAQTVPGVYVAGAFAGQSQQFNIRGVTQSDYLDTIENPVAFYVDDVYVTSAQGQSMGLYDIERVEILKGPQGTLFGRNATGGLVHVVVAKPVLGEFGGVGQATYGRFSEVNLQAGINVPLGDKVAIRASGLYSRIDNFWKNRYPYGGSGSNPILSFDGPGGNSEGLLVSPRGEDLGGSETYSGRLQLLAEPADNLKVRLTAGYANSRMSVGGYAQEPTIAIIDAQGRVVGEQRVGPNETRLAINPDGSNYTGPVTLIPIANGIFQRPTPGGNFFGYIPFDPQDLELSEDFALSRLNKVTAQLYAGHIDYDFGGATLSSVTAYQRYSKDVYVANGGPTNASAFGADSGTRAWSQELRLAGESDRMRWQVGGFYLNNKVDLLQGILATSGGALANLLAVFAGDPALAEVGSDIVTDLKFESKSISLFGQAEFDFADKWTLIAGARYIHEKQRYDYTQFTAASLDTYKVEGDIVIAPGFQPDLHNRRTFNLWAGKLQLEYRPADELLLYAGVNRGVKAGNYNAPFALSPTDVLPQADLFYKPEVLLSYETGFKWSSGPLTFNSSAFYYDYKDFQAFVFATFAGNIKNVDSKVYGVDTEARLEVTRNLRLGANFAYTHASIKNFEVAPGVERTVRPPYSPRMQATGTIDYSVPTPVVGGDLSLRGSVSYASAIYHNIRNFEAQRFAGRTLVDLSATWANAEGLSLTLYGRNIFDKRYGQIGFDNTTTEGAQEVSYGPPATYGVTVAFKFR